MAEWFRQGPAKPRTSVRFRPPPLPVRAGSQPYWSSVDAAFEALLGNPDFGMRSRALLYLYENAPDDQRLIPALVHVLDHEPRTYTRATAAKFLGFIGSAPETTLPTLEAVAAEDEDPEVRSAARYALRLLHAT